MRAAPLPTALAAALAAHAVVAFAVAWIHAPATSSISAPAPEELFVLDDESRPEPSSPEEEPSPRETVRPGLVASRNAMAPAPSSVPERTHADAPPGEPPAEPWSMPRSAVPMDVGLGTSWRSVATSSAMPPPPVAEAPPASSLSLDRILRADLDAHDRALGLNAGSPLVSAAHDAASRSLAPDVGAATLDIESDASGNVVGARVVSATADVAAWNDVARRIVQLMTGKPLKLPRDARGLRTRLRIVAERSLPSGAKVPPRPGAVPDEVCDGAGSQRRCVAGLPAGASGSFDVTDIGAKASRIVRVQLLGDLRL